MKLGLFYVDNNRRCREARYPGYRRMPISGYEESVSFPTCNADFEVTATGIFFIDDAGNVMRSAELVPTIRIQKCVTPVIITVCNYGKRVG